ncbi:MAG: hypothetical protein AAFX87_12715 [Bacteroidota bacterium]
MKTRALIGMILGMLVSTFIVGQDRNRPVLSPDQLTFTTTFEKHVLHAYLKNNKQLAYNMLVASDERTTPILAAQWQMELKGFTNEMQKKLHKYSSDKRALKSLFYKIHRKYLKRYSPFSTFHETIKSGKYDCLSATALYAYLLDELDYNYSVVETNYHIYLIIELEDEQILIETTDPLNGFVDDQTEVLKRMTAYAGGKETGPSANARAPKNALNYEFSVDVERRIGLPELAALQYYNASVQSFNQQEYMQALVDIEKAVMLYGSDRIVEMFGLILNTTLSSNLVEKEDKEHLQHKYAQLLKKNRIMAAR